VTAEQVQLSEGTRVRIGHYHIPSLPGLGVTGATFDETVRRLREGIPTHLGALAQDEAERPWLYVTRPSDAPALSVRARSRYEGLTQFLQRVDGESARWRFSELEQGGGFSLPPSARRYRQWWSNAPERHTQARAWLAAGWRVKDVDLPSEVVTVTRVPK
jgi:hypothetical protein